MTRVRDLLSVKVLRATPEMPQDIQAGYLEEILGTSSLTCICHLTTLSILMFLHLLGTKKEEVRHGVVPAVCFHMAETGTEMNMGRHLQGKKGMSMLKRGSL